MDDAPAFMSLADFSRLHGVAKSAVTGWKRRGYLVLVEGGKVDVAASNARLAARPTIVEVVSRRYGPGKPADEKGIANTDTLGRERTARCRAIRRRRAGDMVAARGSSPAGNRTGSVAQIEVDRAAGSWCDRGSDGAVRGEYTSSARGVARDRLKLAHRLAAARRRKVRRPGRHRGARSARSANAGQAHERPRRPQARPPRGALPPPLLSLSLGGHVRSIAGRSNAMPGRFVAFGYQKGWLDSITDPLCAGHGDEIGEGRLYATWITRSAISSTKTRARS